MARKPLKLVNIEIDGRPHQVRADEYLLWTARELGYDIPHFCAHKWLEPFGGCRMCMVKIEVGGRMMPKLQTACSTKPVEGMKMLTRHPEVLKAREEQLEFHLINHPLECPVCDKGGECMLQDQVFDHGLGEGRYEEEKRVRPDAIVSEYIRMNYKRCIQCKRCVHFGEDIDGSHLLKFVKRGADTRIEGFPLPGVAPRFTGNTIDMCPVGALTARSYRFMGRPWEQELRASVGSLDSVGANIWVCARLGEIARIVPRDNPAVENGLIDDATRFSWEAVDDPRRLRKSILLGADGERQVSRSRGEEEVARILLGAVGEHGQDSVGVIAGGGLNTEEYLALRRFCGADLDTAYYYFGEELFGGESPDDAALAGLLNECVPVEDILAATTVLSIGCDLFEEAPALGLRVDVAARRGQVKLLSLRSHGSEADRFATLAETYPHGDLLRVLRGLANHLAGQGEAPPELKPLADELRSIGEDCAILFGQEVWQSENALELIHALVALQQAIKSVNPDAAGVSVNAVYPSVNSAGALLVNNLQRFAGQAALGARPSVGSLRAVLEAAAGGKLKALLIVETDVLSLYPDRALVEQALGAAPVVYLGAFPVPTAEQAAVHLPLGTWVHREGTVISLEWRVQKRCQAVVETVAPSVLDVVNCIAAAADGWPVAESIEALSAELALLLPGFPGAQFEDFPKAGVLWTPRIAAPGGVRLSTELPLRAVAPEGRLTLIPKRFLYNDRPEVRFSPVFERVAKPLWAHFNPVDAARLGIVDEALVQLSGAGGAISLPARLAGWVEPGTVVLNDYVVEAPANTLGSRLVEVSVARPVAASGS
jgi:NADH-quinone oxidoreductase subunit G